MYVSIIRNSVTGSLLKVQMRPSSHMSFCILMQQYGLHITTNFIWMSPYFFWDDIQAPGPLLKLHVFEVLVGRQRLKNVLALMVIRCLF